MIAYIIITGVLTAGLAVAGLVVWKTRPTKKYTRSLLHFAVREPYSNTAVGAVIAVMFWVISLGLVLSGEAKENPQSLVTMGFFLFFGLVMMMCALPGVWEIRVNDNEIEVVRFFIVRKSYTMMDIRECKERQGWVKVYVFDRERMAFRINNTMLGYRNFLKRMKKEGISIEKVNMRV